MARSLRIVAYAVNGGGAGHLQRLTAILRWARRYALFCASPAEVFFLTSSEADTFLFHEGFASFKLPSKTSVASAGIDKLAYLALAKQWVWHSIGLLRPDVLLVDTFPNGSFGELVSALDLARHRVFVYRPVKEEYARRPDFQAMLPLYDLILVPEAREAAGIVVPPKAEASVRYTGPITVREGWEARGRAEARAHFGIPEGRVAVLLSAGAGGDPTAEETLLSASRLLLSHPEVHVVVAAGPLYRGARTSGERVVWVSEPALAEWLAAFDFAVTAAGYNTVLELMSAGVPAVLLPQEKVADEQDRRARAAVEAGAALSVEPAAEGRLDEAVRRYLDAGNRERASARALSLVPRNAARDAAAEVLELVLPPHEVEAAQEAVTDGLLSLARSTGAPVEGLFDLVHALDGSTGGSGRFAGTRRARAASDAAAELLRNATDLGIPGADAVRLLLPLQKRLLRGPLGARREATRQVLASLAPFGDWNGALHLLRSLTPSREAEAADVAADLKRRLAPFPRNAEGLLRASAALQADPSDAPPARRPRRPGAGDGR